MIPATPNITATAQVGNQRPAFDHGLFEQETAPDAWGAEQVRHRQIGLPA